MTYEKQGSGYDSGATGHELQGRDKSKKCLVHKCTNYKGEGGFVGDLCTPCHHVITTGRVDVPGNTFINDLVRKDVSKVSVFQDWLFNLTMQQQSVLVLACRGPDNIGKFHPSKNIVTHYRASVLKAAYLGRPMKAGESDNTTFMSLQHLNEEPADWHTVETTWFYHVDEIAHHYNMHLMHGAQIIGYKHPDELFRSRWSHFYFRSCDELHLYPETETQMDRRLNDWDRKHWDVDALGWALSMNGESNVNA